MTSKAKRRANRRNAKKSTGPKTDQGKQTCSQNALKHGLRSKHPVIPGEDPIEYEHKLERLRADIRPVNALEDDLVEQIADTSWRLKRLARIEAAIEQRRIETAAGDKSNLGKDEQQIFGAGFSGWAKLDYLNRLGRYEAQLSRRYHRAVKELRDLRKHRQETLIRERPMEERDREEQHWRERHGQSLPEKIQPQPVAAAAENSDPAEQSQYGPTSLNSMTKDEVAELHPMETLKLIERELQAMSPVLGQPGLQEVKK